jgi:hypothetical protein
MVASTFLARDDLGDTIQVLPCRPEGGWIVSVAATGASKLVGPFQAATRIVTIRAVGTAILFQPGVDANVAVEVPIGDVDGGGPHYLPSGGSIDIAMVTTASEPALTYLAVCSAAATAGTVYVSERG